MTLNITLPTLSGSSDSSKDAIVSILAREHPLKAKQMHERLKREFKGDISYQAVHKALTELEQQKVLKKDNGTYELNKDWVDNIESFAKSVLGEYYGSREFVDSKTIVTNSLYETDMMLLEVASKMLVKPTKKPILCLHWNHAWIPLFLNNEKYYGLKHMIDGTESYILIRGKTVVDEWCSDYWAKRGSHKKIGMDVAATIDFAVFEDHIIQVFYPAYLKKDLDTAFSRVKDISKLDTGELFEKVFMKPAKITVIVTRNKLLAEQLREETLSYFK